MHAQIAAAFDSGTLLRPSAGEPDLVHLARTLAILSGVQRFDRSSAATGQLLEAIGPTEHLVFVLLDGMGMNLVRRMPASSFIARQLKRSIRATCPSTTACALTSVATGDWPAAHAVTGWFTHCPERGFSMTTLPMVERLTGEPLSARGIGAGDVLPLAAFHREMSLRPLTLLPLPIVDTVFARYSRAGTPASPYGSLPDAVDQVLGHVNGAAERTYTHLYVPDVDTACHHDGVGADGVLELLLKLDSELIRLRESLTPRARIVISADHGLLDVPVERHMHVFAGDPLMDLLQAPPSGDARLPIFHVRTGCEREFARIFDDRYGDSMRLLSSDEADELRLFGPDPMSELARGRFGTYVGIALRPATLHYAAVPPEGATAGHKVYLAQHAGLTRDEMEIPLIVA
jgi:hypothetical protein